MKYKDIKDLRKRQQDLLVYELNLWVIGDINLAIERCSQEAGSLARYVHVQHRTRRSSSLTLQPSPHIPASDLPDDAQLNNELLGAPLS